MLNIFFRCLERKQGDLITPVYLQIDPILMECVVIFMKRKWILCLLRRNLHAIFMRFVLLNEDFLDSSVSSKNRHFCVLGVKFCCCLPSFLRQTKGLVLSQRFPGDWCIPHSMHICGIPLRKKLLSLFCFQFYVLIVWKIQKILLENKDESAIYDLSCNVCITIRREGTGFLNTEKNKNHQTS